MKKTGKVVEAYITHWQEVVSIGRKNISELSNGRSKITIFVMELER